jgi:hypothetical protein
MNHQCPKCRREYDAGLNFCPQCGEPSKASKNSAKESPNKNETASGSSVSKVTSHMSEFFPSNPRRVEPLADTEDDGRTAEFSHSQDSLEDSAAVQGATRRANEDTGLSRSPSPLASEAAYYRSFRTLSRTIIISNALMALSVIGFALIFTFSQQRMWNKSQEALIAVLEKAMASNQNTLAAKLEQVNTSVEQSHAVILDLQQKIVNQEQKIAATAEIVRQVNVKWAEQQLAVLSPKLTKKERGTFLGSLASAKIENKSDKRSVEALKQQVLRNGDRTQIYKNYVRLLPKAVRAQMEERDGRPLLGD